MSAHLYPIGMKDNGNAKKNLRLGAEKSLKDTGACRTTTLRPSYPFPLALGVLAIFVELIVKKIVE